MPTASTTPDNPIIHLAAAQDYESFYHGELAIRRARLYPPFADLCVIGFVGVICPHVTKKLLGQDHRYSIPVSALCGSLLLLLADTLSRSMGSGSALPVGAITSLLGAPFFVAVIFSKKEDGVC